MLLKMHLNFVAKSNCVVVWGRDVVGVVLTSASFDYDIPVAFRLNSPIPTQPFF